MKRGIKPKGKIRIKWSSNFAYSIGLIVSDGNLSPDGRHIVFSSKEKEMIDNFQLALGTLYKYYMKSNGINSAKKYYVIQIGDVIFYRFLLSIGIMPNKSKIIGKISVPDIYIRDFIRGSFDGDGSSYSYWDKRWKSSYLLYIQFASASYKHIIWLQNIICEAINIKGHITKSGNNTCFQLRFAKAESKILSNYMYKNRSKSLYLYRKYLKIKESLAIVSKQEKERK